MKKSKIKPISTSKLIMWTVILICVEIIIFSEYAMLRTNDISALYTLIGVPVTLVPSVLGYYHKAMRENCEGGVVYETTINGTCVNSDIGTCVNSDCADSLENS